MRAVYLFELRFRLRQVSTYLFFLVLFLLTFLFVTTDAVKIGGGDGQVKVNAPIVLSQIVGIMGAFGAVIASALVGTAIYRDFEAQAHELFFTTRLSRASYFFGRYLGALTITLFVFSGLLFGVLFGTAMPWVDKASLGPFRLESYVNVFFTILLPNVLFLSALFFVFGTLTRSLLAIYLQGVLVFVGWAIALALLGSVENRMLASLFDPFGLASTGVVTRYWTLAEKNTQLLPLTGALLYNRLLWLAVAATLLMVGFRLFQFSARAMTIRKKPLPPTSSELPLPSSPRSGKQSEGRGPGGGMSGGMPSGFTALLRFYFRDIVRSVPFLVIAAAGMLLLITNAWMADKLLDNTIYPVTRVMVEQVSGSFMLFFLILITFYAGELAWRERTVKLDQIADALPVPTYRVALAKFMALLLVLALLTGGLIVAGVAVQAAKGYFHFELGLYVSYLFGTIYPTLVCLTALAFFVHTVVNQKFLGHTLVLVSFIATQALPSMGLDHKLYLFGDIPTVKLSDMNGFGPFVQPVFWFASYWLLASVLLVIVAIKLWVRGKDDRLALRWQVGQLPPAARAIAAACAAGFVAIGGWIFVNTNLRHTYRPEKEQTKLRVEFEQKYKARYEKIPQPRITDVELDVTLWPERGQWESKGVFTLKNKTDKPVTELVVQTDPDLTVKALTLGAPATPGITDKDRGFRTLTLAQPLAPGATTTLAFTLAYDKVGFSNGEPNTAIAANGAFVTMPCPQLGYQTEAELSDESERRRQKLAPKARMAPASDQEARKNTYIGPDADWVSFAATVRTAPDQTAIAPGYLEKEWSEDGRRCFRYKMDAPIRHFVTFVSARYAVKRDQWVGKDGKKVALEIFYHPGHEYNLERMMAGAKAALSYCSENFSPYQFRQLRILEFPAYQQFAQSFPNTVPYSEGIGFILKVGTEKDALDIPFYVTAHEVAHQWWAHQVLGGNVAGSELLSESLAEYSALQTLKKAYGKEALARFLKLDMDRYLRGRGSEREEENPLTTMQHQQYIHYPKGAIAFCALADRIGEGTLNAALAGFVKKTAFQEPPYTTALELMETLRAATPSTDQAYLSDLFEKITLYDLRLTDAKKEKVGGKWRVTVTYTAVKKYADGKGNETDAGPATGFGFGLWKKEQALPVKTVTSEPGRVVLETDSAEPDKVEVDPQHLYIDRTLDDNTKKL
ncbi:ABC transporter permease/M1 family aminopeptidase [Armatimonas rosea]|uniref:ABC-type transport system involved in multi-copper enzyme maturation permease subunit n=1 Tax=Armatimonas rosea TaxID=685828 RepID=A0A7W9SQF5_ARMRO|nr:hypothetical protein [Armatimonas rosea]MBB6050304.1 ABC-type transport system involved in multi-copper enzyme maturation permease subunit [Armatimonas rosea]